MLLSEPLLLLLRHFLFTLLSFLLLHFVLPLKLRKAFVFLLSSHSLCFLLSSLSLLVSIFAFLFLVIFGFGIAAAV